MISEKNKKQNVLMAPVHFFYTSKYGSEMLWAYKIFNKISTSPVINSEGVVFEIVENEGNVNIHYKNRIEKPYFYSLLDTLRFLFFYTIRGWGIIRKKKVRILHHILPFSIDHTFNPLFFLTSRKVKKVIGPIQTPLNYVSKDLGKDDLFAQKNQRTMLFIQWCFSRPFLFLSRKTLGRADCVIVINKLTMKQLIKKGVSSKKIKCIPPGIDTDTFRYVNFNDKSKNQIEIITVGYLYKRKGVELIIKALKKIVNGNKNVRFRIVGDGPQKKSLEKLVEELELKEFVIFEGFIPNEKIQKYYQQAHIFVSMSRSESWGQMYLEAMACGLPVVTTKNDGSNEIIKDGKFGYLIEQEDYNALAEKVIHLATNHDIIKKFGLEARKEIENKYDWDKVIIPKYLDIYNELLKK